MLYFKTTMASLRSHKKKNITIRKINDFPCLNQLINFHSKCSFFCYCYPAALLDFSYPKTCSKRRNANFRKPKGRGVSTKNAKRYLLDGIVALQDWLPVRREIETLLRERGIFNQVYVQFERGDVCAIIDFPLRPPSLASISDERDIIQGITSSFEPNALVGHILLNLPSQTLFSYFLTYYHAICSKDL